MVKEDIPQLPETDKTRVRKAIEEKLRVSPEVFGKPLRQSLKGYRKLRVDDYRIIFRIEGDMVKIFYNAHRSVVYQKVEKRV